jgi:hypothetical protein
VLLECGPGEHDAEPGPALARGEERRPDAPRDLGRHASAGVDHRDADVPAVLGDLDLDATAAGTCVDGVRDEVEQRPAQLDRDHPWRRDDEPACVVGRRPRNAPSITAPSASVLPKSITTGDEGAGRVGRSWHGQTGSSMRSCASRRSRSCRCRSTSLIIQVGIMAHLVRSWSPD